MLARDLLKVVEAFAIGAGVFILVRVALGRL